jgi:hypothetical protein
VGVSAIVLLLVVETGWARRIPNLAPDTVELLRVERKQPARRDPFAREAIEPDRRPATFLAASASVE